VGRILVVVLVVVAVLAAIPILYLDRLAHRALERGASDTFGQRTEVGSVSLGLLSGRVGVGDFRVRNPEGWQEKHFLAIEDGRFSVGLPTFLEETVIVPEFVLRDVSLALERSVSGKSNYGEILRHMQSGPPPDPAAEPGKKFVIRDLRIENVEAKLRLEGAGGVVQKALDVTIPEIRLRDVGSESEGGVVAAQVWRTVATAVMEAVARESGGLAGFLTADLRNQLARVTTMPFQVVGEVTRLTGEGVEEVGRGVGRVIDEATGGVLKGAGDAVGETGEAAGKVLKGLGGVLGGGEKPEQE
jgi:hypothetical protein